MRQHIYRPVCPGLCRAESCSPRARCWPCTMKRSPSRRTLVRSFARPPKSGLKEVRSFCGLSWSDSLYTVQTMYVCHAPWTQNNRMQAAWRRQQLLRCQSALAIFLHCPTQRLFVLCRRQLLRAHIIIQSTMSTEMQQYTIFEGLAPVPICVGLFPRVLPPDLPCFPSPAGFFL